MSHPSGSIERSYVLARERYAGIGVDAERAMARLAQIAVSLHCWQGDDVGGFELTGQSLGGGLAVTGQLTRARPARPTSLRTDLEKALALVPGNKTTPHAAEPCTPATPRRRQASPRRALDASHFRNWIGLGTQ
jgi:L-rhamnose isomerase